MIPANLLNPFHALKADDLLKVPPGNVPELHQRALDECLGALRLARQTNTSTGMLLLGEAGSGKSHLIARFRETLAADPNAVLIGVRLSKAFAGRLWRHLREKMVEELLRESDDAVRHPSGMLRILRNRFPKWGEALQRSGGILGILVGKTRPSLLPSLIEFGRSYPLQNSLQTVLPQLFLPETEGPARQWLRGQQLGTEDLKRLGVPEASTSEQDQEIQAQEVVQSFLHLAGDKTTLAICFDQVEAIQAGVTDPNALRQFATLVSDLLGEPGPRVVVTSIRPKMLFELRKSVEHADVQRMQQLYATIPPLTWEQVIRVVVARLEVDPQWQAHRKVHAKEPHWPLTQEFLKALYREHHRSLTPRHLISACRVEVERLRQGESQHSPAAVEEAPQPKTQQPIPKPEPSNTEPPAATPRPGRKSDAFMSIWEKMRKHRLEKPQAVHFDTVMAKGLPWLVELTEIPYLRVENSGAGMGDVNLLFQPSVRRSRPLGLSFCNQNAQALWPRLDRLQRQWENVKDKQLGALVLLRSAAERTAPGGAQRLEKLKQVGVRLILLDAQQLSELGAFQEMLALALQGEFMRDGSPVEASEYNAWAKAHLSEAVKELLDHVFFEQDSLTCASAQATPLSVTATQRDGQADQEGREQRLRDCIANCRSMLEDALRPTLNGNDADIQDVLQEVWIVADHHRMDGSTEEQRRRLQGIARNKACDHLRKANRGRRRRAPLPTEEVQDPRPAPTEQVDEEDEKRKVLEVIDNLPEGDRSIIRERYIEGKTFEEVGQRVGLSTGQVCRRAGKVIEQLKERIDRRTGFRGALYTLPTPIPERAMSAVVMNLLEDRLRQELEGLGLDEQIEERVQQLRMHLLLRLRAAASDDKVATLTVTRSIPGKKPETLSLRNAIRAGWVRQAPGPFGEGLRLVGSGNRDVLYFLDGADEELDIILADEQVAEKRQ